MAGLCLSEIKHAHTDDEVRQKMAWAKCDQRRVLFAATARRCAPSIFVRVEHRAKDILDESRVVIELHTHSNINR
jgi:hypothetical protein